VHNPMYPGRVSRRGLLAAAIAGTGGLRLRAEPIWQSTIPTTRPFERPFRLLCAPVLTNAAPDAVTVIWAANAPATGWVEFGESEQLGRRANGWNQGLLPYEQRYTRIRVSGLKPGTRYFYRVHAEYTVYDWHKGILCDLEPPAVSDIFTFTTPSLQAAETRFTVWNDTHEHVDTLRALFAIHERSPDDFLVWNGDIGTDLYSEDRMLEQYLSPAGQPFAARVPYYFVRGNHDTRGPYARLIGQVTDVPDGKFYYTFRQGPLAAIVLDTGEPTDDDSSYYRFSDFEPLRAMETRWLDQAIEAPEFRSAPFRVVFCHIPLWWKNEQDMGTYCLDARKKWHDLLVRGRVQMIISGHTHDYDCYLANDRHPYVQLIGGDHRPRAATYIQGHATADQLTVTQYRLSGETLHEIVIRA
jgi:acid phosphatase type 7